MDPGKLSLRDDGSRISYCRMVNPDSEAKSSTIVKCLPLDLTSESGCTTASKCWAPHIQLRQWAMSKIMKS